ncbi:MAG: iron ABC transporter permease [Acidobacteria bacterium]|nr:ABC transporter permease subunit [Nitrosomonas nitrosa]MBL8172489.1 iron ABC transporter permease [Acidobacteriota bacterium]
MNSALNHKRFRPRPLHTAACWLGIVLFFALCASPAISMFGLSFISDDGGLSFAHYRRLLAEPRQQSLLLNSVLLGTGASTLAILLGAPLGLLLGRSDVRGKTWWRLALVVPLVVPPYVLALAWTQWAGATGLPAEWTYSLTSAVCILGLSFYPLVMLATEAAARRVQASLEEAALLVAAPSRVAIKITLPLIAPAIAAAALVVFVLALAEFGVPGLLRVNVFTTDVFTAFAALYDFGAATALSVPLLLVTLLAAVLAARLTGEARLTARQSGRAGLALHLGGWRIVADGLLLFVLLVSVCLPLLALAREAASLSRLVAAFKDSGDAVLNSLAWSSAGATLAVTLALLPAYARARMKSQRAAQLFDLLFITLFAVPGTVVGVGLIGLWNRPGTAAIYTSPLIIVLAYLTRFAPVAALLLAAGMRQMPISLEEAAAVSGASWWRSFTRIVLPNLKSSLAAAWAVVFIFAFGEIGATILVAPPGEATLPVRLYTLIANTSASNVAALALTQVLIAVLPLALFAAFTHGKERAQ